LLKYEYFKSSWTVNEKVNSQKRNNSKCFLRL
jgi:hypothetical protein